MTPNLNSVSLRDQNFQMIRNNFSENPIQCSINDGFKIVLDDVINFYLKFY